MKASLILTCLAFSLSGLAQSQAITTAQYNRRRTGANTSEVTLNTANVNALGFGKLSSWFVDGYVFAQPLYVPGLNINGAIRNVLFVATMNNSIYAFDTADPGSAPLWQRQFGAPVTNFAQYCPTFGQANGYELGILSTPVIDPGTNTIYAVTSNPGSGGYYLNLRAINILTGRQTTPPVRIIPLTDTLVQRTGLLLGNRKIYAALGNCGPDAGPYNGGVVVHDKTSLAQLALFNATSSGRQGGIWQSGGGLVLDNSGNVYFNTGNETPSGTDYAMSVVKLSPAGTVLGHFTPSNAAALNQYDLDLSSTGPIRIPGNLLVSAGKEGVGYLLDASDMSLVGGTSFQLTRVCSPFTFSGCFQIHQLAFWNNILYVWGGSDILRTYNYSNRAFSPGAQNSSVPPPDYTGAPLAVSANGVLPGTGILWAVDASSVVHAFDASNVANELWNSNMNPARDQLPSRAKFTVPTVADGKVYVASNAACTAPCSPGQIVVYGLLPASDFIMGAPLASQTIAQGQSATYSVNVSPQNGFTEPVALSVSSPLPVGVTAQFTPTSITASGAAALTLASSPSARLGSFGVMIQGSSGKLKHTSTVALVIEQSTQSDTDPPSVTCCTVLDPNPLHFTLQYTARDTGSGMSSIITDSAVGGTANIPQFTDGTTSPVTFTTTHTVSETSFITLQLTDVAGNIAIFDPLFLGVSRETGSPQEQSIVHKSVLSAERTATVINGSPGLTSVRLDVNGVQFQVAGLRDGEQRNIDISSGLEAPYTLGNSGNTMIVTPLGKPGGTAVIMLSNVR